MFTRFHSEWVCRSARRLRAFAAVVVVLVGMAATSQTLADNGGGPNWSMIGNDSTNSRNQPFETEISPANVGSNVPPRLYAFSINGN
jgi:hypothetical protein